MKVDNSYILGPISTKFKLMSKIVFLSILITFFFCQGKVLALEVTKTVSTYIEEVNLWSINKYANLSTIDVLVGESFSINYTVDVYRNVIEYYSVDGSIFVYNNTDTLATILSITDEISGGISADVDFSQSNSLVGPGSTNQYNYFAELPDSSTRINTATVTTFGTGTHTDTETVEFSNAIISSIDSGALITDSLVGELGFVDEATTFYYEWFFEPFYEVGTYNIINTAQSFGLDSGTIRSDDWMITVNVTPVPEPSTFLLLGGGLAGLAFVVRRRKKE